MKHEDFPSVSRLLTRLRQPLERVTPGELLLLWRRHQIKITCKRPLDFDDGPGFPARVRGAWGHELGRTHVACAPKTQGIEAFPLHALLFASAGKLRNGDERPKCYVVESECLGDHITICVTLFGFPGYWAAQAADALCRALQGGLKIGSDARARAALEITSFQIERFDTVTPPAMGYGCFLFFDTPIDIPVFRNAELDGLTKHDADALRSMAFFRNLANRVSGLARWQDFRLSLNWSNLFEVAGRLRFDTSALRELRWHRWSRNSPGSPIAMVGERPRIYIEGNLEPLWALLALGETCHVGENASLGLGRYALKPV